MTERNDNQPPGHIHIRPECGICGGGFILQQRIVTLLGNNDSTTCELHTDVFTFPNYSYQTQLVSDRYLCRFPDCSNCAVSPEASSIHSDCFEIFMRNWHRGKPLDSLWIATAWRNPWKGAPDLRLQNKTDITLSILPTAEKYCIPQLSLLPRELIHAIQKYSERYILALDHVYRLSRGLSNEPVPIPLSEISVWQREGRPNIAEATRGRIIRVTIDCRGIKKIERLLKYPQFSSSRFDNMAFVIQEESHISNVVVWFKNGLVRLKLPEGLRSLHIWDTPTPPDLELCEFCPAHITASTRFQTIDMCRTFGITFFFDNDFVYAIHPHTSALPCAKTTFEHLSRLRQTLVTWVYLPIAPSDQVVAFGVQLGQYAGHFVTNQPRLLFRTRLAGDISIGPHRSGHTGDFVLSKAPPTILIYNAADILSVSVIGAYSTERCDGRPLAPFRHPAPGEPPFPDACFSSAPLEDVARVHIFHGEESAYCRGILFEYENGAEQAVGQCRLGVDPHKTCVAPLSFCFLHESYTLPRTEVRREEVRVEFTCDPEHHHDKDGWTCLTMGGLLRFWFTNKESHLSVAMD